MSVILDGRAIADPADIEHLSRILRPCLCICLDHGITEKIITTLSLNIHKLAVILRTELCIEFLKELFPLSGDFSNFAWMVYLCHTSTSFEVFSPAPVLQHKSTGCCRERPHKHGSVALSADGRKRGMWPLRLPTRRQIVRMGLRDGKLQLREVHGGGESATCAET